MLSWDQKIPNIGRIEPVFRFLRILVKFLLSRSRWLALYRQNSRHSNFRLKRRCRLGCSPILRFLKTKFQTTFKGHIFKAGCSTPNIQSWICKDRIFKVGFSKVGFSRSDFQRSDFQGRIYKVGFSMVGFLKTVFSRPDFQGQIFKAGFSRSDFQGWIFKAGFTRSDFQWLDF